jgi:hypothetical protein
MPRLWSGLQITSNSSKASYYEEIKKASSKLWPTFQSWGAVTASPSANSIATMLISKIEYGWQKKGYIYVLVGESSGFCCALTNQLPGGGWSKTGALSVNGMLL